MITEQTVYWITRLNGILILLMVLAILSFVSAVFTAVKVTMDIEVDDKRSKKRFTQYTIILLIITLILSLAIILTPDTKTMIAIMIIPKIVNNEKLHGITDKTLQLIDVKVDEWIKNIIPHKEEK